MMRDNLYKLMKYLLLAIIIYLILRYTPYVGLDPMKSLLVMFVLVILWAVVEYFLGINYNQDENCGSCNVDKGCRIVCDGREKFGDTSLGNYGTTVPSGIASNTTVKVTQPSEVVVRDASKPQTTVSVIGGNPNQIVPDPYKVDSVIVNTATTGNTPTTTSVISDPVYAGRPNVVIEGRSPLTSTNTTGYNTTATDLRYDDRRFVSSDSLKYDDISGNPKYYDTRANMIFDDRTNQLAAGKRQDQVIVETSKKPVNDDRYYWGSRYGEMGYDNRYGFGGMYYDEYPYYNRFITNDTNMVQAGGDKFSDISLNSNRAKREEVFLENAKKTFDERARGTVGYSMPYQDPGALSEKRKAIEINRRIEGPLDDELPYSDYNHLPIAAGYKSHDYEYGYNYLPPEKWYPQPPRAPVCISDRRCPVVPTLASGTPADVKEFHQSRRITGPDMISTDYINDVLNAG